MQQIQTAVCRLAVHLRVLSLIAILLVAGTVRAQVAGKANLQGTVTDPTGAVIAKAAVTLTEESTQVQLTTATDGSGIYSFPNVQIGTYTLGVISQGFETYTQSGIVLEVGSSIAVNVKMTVGAETQKVEVQAEGLALQTEDVTFKQTIDQKEVLEMPLNGGGSIGTNPRQMTSLVLGAGGAVAAPGNDYTGSKYSYAAVSISIAGGMGNSILWRLDGGDNIDYMANANLPFPFPEAVSQFSVEASSLGAQDGMHEGGMVNMVTKSGTNAYHGTGFEFIRNNLVDATNFYVTTCTPVAPKTTCSPKDKLHQNQYGGTIGGPLSIPHLYNGKDKLFFFVGYQYFESKSATATTSANVPTAANLIGDFSTTAPINSTLASANGACQTTPTQLLDPLTGAKLINNQCNNPAMGLNNPVTQLPTWNLQSQALLAFLPPVVASVDTFNCGVVKYAIPSQTFDKQLITREDYTINSKNHMYGRYLFDGYQFPAYFSPTNILLTTQSGNPLQRVQTGTVGEDYTINGNTVNSAHISILRRVNVRGYNTNDINACAGLGVNITCALPVGLQLTTKVFSMGGGTNSLSHFNDNTLAFDDDVTMVRGKHQFVFGGEYVRNQLNISNGFQSNGNFTFSNSFSEYGPFGARPAQSRIQT